MFKFSNSLVISILIHTVIIFNFILLLKDIKLKNEATQIEKKLSITLYTPTLIEKTEINKITPEKKIHPIKTDKEIIKSEKKIKTINKNVTKNIIKVKDKSNNKIPVKHDLIKIDTKLISTEKDIIKKEEKLIKKKIIQNKTENTKENTKENKANKYIKNNLLVIKNLIEQNLYYPKSARRRGIQGDVIVKFQLSKDGKVSFISIISSKHKILSRSAIKTIKDISGKFPNSKEELIITLPIKYTLNR